APDGGAAAARGRAAASEDAGDRSARGSETEDLASGNVGGAVAGFFGHIAEKAAAKRARREMDGGAGKPVFSARVEVLSVDVGSVPASTFEVPKGWKKKA
ncbi:MAG: hypothetical protein KGM24_14840, partial [Elusimicrobia bacterium]|nr:hypothetical protein [Elusimicrobiota bacterium]